MERKRRKKQMGLIMGVILFVYMGSIAVRMKKANNNKGIQ